MKRRNDNHSPGVKPKDQTKLEDIFISMKSTAKFHETRLRVLLDTWIPNAINQTYVFTDTDDLIRQRNFPVNYVINTNCSTGHGHKALCCKMASEFDAYFKTDKRWFCHVDDDNYVNVPNL